MTDAVAFAAARIPPVASIALDGMFARAVQAAIDAKTKPPGSLRRLESLALHLACVQQRMQPRLDAGRSRRCATSAASRSR